jgi:hypothetical protein
MKRILMSVLGSALAVMVVSAAMAQSTDPAAGDKKAPSTQTGSPESAQPSTTPAPDAGASKDATPAPEAAKAAVKTEPASTEAAMAKSNPALDKVKERGLKAPEKDRLDVDKKLDEIEKQIENEASAKGDAAVAGRIAGEFGLTADALTAERSQYSRGWGELLVAHAIVANAKTPMTMENLFQLRTQGIGWGQIAAGLDLKLADVVTAVKTEGRVATGLAKGDGKPATIQAMGAVSAGAKAKAPKAKGEAKGGVSAAGAGVGAGVDLNKGAGK